MWEGQWPHKYTIEPCWVQTGSKRKWFSGFVRSRPATGVRPSQVGWRDATTADRHATVSRPPPGDRWFLISWDNWWHPRDSIAVYSTGHRQPRQAAVHPAVGCDSREDFIGGVRRTVGIPRSRATYSMSPLNVIYSVVIMMSYFEHDSIRRRTSSSIVSPTTNVQSYNRMTQPSTAGSAPSDSYLSDIAGMSPK